MHALRCCCLKHLRSGRAAPLAIPQDCEEESQHGLFFLYSSLGWSMILAAGVKRKKFEPVTFSSLPVRFSNQTTCSRREQVNYWFRCSHESDEWNVVCEINHT